MPVQVQRQLHRVQVTHLHCLVQQREHKVLTVIGEFDAHNLIGGLDLFKELKLYLESLRGLSKSPELYSLV